jgi:hypothetical protein
MAMKTSAFSLLWLMCIAGAFSPGAQAQQAGSKSTAAAQVSASRPFRMGFSTWPYDLSLEAVSWTDRAIQAHGDIIEQHFEEGVPWPEALENKTYTLGMEKEIKTRVARMSGFHRVVSINPINTGRTGLAPYRGDQSNMNLPPQWQHKRLNDPQVKAAYLQYVERIVGTMQPDYLLIGVEVNLLQRCKDTSWADYLELHKYIYQNIKVRHPSIPIMASVVSTCYFPGLSQEDDATAQRSQLKNLLPYVDVLGFSVHPFMSAWTAEKVPDAKFFTELFALAQGKPFAITESSYPAQKWQIQSGNNTVRFNGTIEKQAAFLKTMLDASATAGPRFVCWFCIRDYDQLWDKLRQMSSLIVWRDTGLIDETGRPRMALAVWDSFFKSRFSGR